ncbi:MAG: GatB/YqeY domain-containing protein [Anaerolineae bacterium]
MSLKDRLTQDLKQALREGDERRKIAIRLVKWAVQNAEVDRGRELDDGEILEIIAREAKKRRESVAEFTKAGRQDLVEQEEAELNVLFEYLPRQMSRQEIEVLVRQTIEEIGATGPTQMGDVMRRLMPQLKGKADGRLVNQVVREVLTTKV